MARKQKIIEQNHEFTTDLTLTFRYVKPKLIVNREVCDDNHLIELQNALHGICERIDIDKSFVISDKSKYEKTFLKEAGWNKLCEVLISSGFGKNLKKAQNSMLFEAYDLMIVNYIYEVLLDADFDVEGVIIDIDREFPYIVEVNRTGYDAWKLYAGRWQEWDDNN